MRITEGVLALVLAAVVATACGDDDDAPMPDGSVPVPDGAAPDGAAQGCGPWTGAQPAGTVAVNFSVDDTANQTYLDGDGLAWKGSLLFDATTRCFSFDPSWGGPFALLYDDGPWDAGGHEPLGATADDHVFGVTAFYPTPAADQAFEYGAVRSWSEGELGDWIWEGPNGSFTVPAGSTAPITVTGLVIEAFGTTDVRFLLDTDALAPEFAGFDPANGITIKGSGWGWLEIGAVDTGAGGDDVAGDGVFTVQLSQHVGGGLLRHDGLPNSGQALQFVWVLGGVEYKVGGLAQGAGVTVQVRPQGAADWLAVIIYVDAGTNNTYVMVP